MKHHVPGLAVILPAAGRSVRFGHGRNKLLENLGDKAVIARAVEAFASRADIVVILVPTNQPALLEPLLAIGGNQLDQKITFCAGGASRAESVLNALRQVPAECEWVAIHDAARPLVSQSLIDRTLAAAQRHGTAVPALPVSVTIKQAGGPLPARVERTVPRQNLWAMQTPQVMRRADLLAAYDACPIPLAEITDDTQLLELVGREVWLVEGEERNLKITTATDLRLAELFQADCV